MKTFGQRLKELRNEKGLTGETLGNVFSVTKVAISSWESGNRFPDKNTLIGIADYFDVSLDYLLARVDDRNINVSRYEVNNNDIEIAVHKDKYPDGLTYEQVIQILEGLKNAGFKLNQHT